METSKKACSRRRIWGSRAASEVPVHFLGEMLGRLAGPRQQGISTTPLADGRSYAGGEEVTTMGKQSTCTASFSTVRSEV